MTFYFLQSSPFTKMSKFFVHLFNQILLLLNFAPYKVLVIKIIAFPRARQCTLLHTHSLLNDSHSTSNSHFARSRYKPHLPKHKAHLLLFLYGTILKCEVLLALLPTTFYGSIWTKFHLSLIQCPNTHRSNIWCCFNLPFPNKLRCALSSSNGHSLTSSSPS